MRCTAVRASGVIIKRLCINCLTNYGHSYSSRFQSSVFFNGCWWGHLRPAYTKSWRCWVELSTSLPHTLRSIIHSFFPRLQSPTLLLHWKKSFGRHLFQALFGSFNVQNQEVLIGMLSPFIGAGCAPAGNGRVGNDVVALSGSSSVSKGPDCKEKEAQHWLHGQQHWMRK